MYLVAALQRGQRRDQGFLLLHREVVLLRVGDGLEPRHHELNELVPGAALQLGQQLNQGFSCLVSVLGHRLHELVLLRSGDGYCAGHHGLVELVLVTTQA